MPFRFMTAGAFLLLATSASAQVPSLESLIPAGDGAVSGRIIQLVVLLTVLSLAPGLLIMVTSFTRFVVAFSFLRSGLGLQSTPANIFLISLSLFMTFFVMGPTFDRAWNDGVRPLTENRISEAEAFTKTTEPFREFMLTHVRPEGSPDVQRSGRGQHPKPSERREDRPDGSSSRPS